MVLQSPVAARERSLPHSREDWLSAALEVLVESGIEAVQITKLAQRMEVTRGSFYWHFKDRDDLLSALVAAWRERNTGVMVAALDGATSLTDGILRLFRVWVDHRKFDPRLDQAMRDWGRRSPEILHAVEIEDDSRIAAITAFFRKFGYGDPDAFIRARILYFTQVSYYALVADEPMAVRMNYLAAYFRGFTGQEIDEEEAEAYRKAFFATKGDVGK